MPHRFLTYREAYPPRKDEQGRYHCRVCGELLEGRRRSFCSDECRDDALIRCGMDVRRIIKKRDKGYCARCGVHVPTLTRRIQHAFWKRRRAWNDPRWRRFLSRIGIDWNFDICKSLWEAHHKHAVKDGGGGAGLEDYETLCVWCHRKETATQHRRWAEERKPEDGQILLEMEA